MIRFVRGRMTCDMSNYYATNTNVVVLGTKRGYREFAAVLGRHAAGTRRPTLFVARGGSPGMDVRVLPTCSDAVRPFIVVQERCVEVRKRKNMELIIGGCKQGFRRIQKYLLRVSERSGGPWDHTFFDETEPLLVLPAVYLSLRHPVPTWNRAGLSDFAGLCFEGSNRNRLPEDAIGSKPAPLTYKDLHGRIPVRRRGS